MSGAWLKAGNRCRLYRQRDYQHRVSAATTRAVLRELCSVAGPAGVAVASVGKLAGRVGLGERAVRYALQRLEADGWVYELQRGTGNRHGTRTRSSVYMLSPLPDIDGVLHPHEGELAAAWLKFTSSRLWQAQNPAERRLWAAAHQLRINPPEPEPLPVDNGAYSVLLAARKTPTSGTCVPPIKRLETTRSEPQQVIDGGHPNHWRSSRSTAPLKAVPT